MKIPEFNFPEPETKKGTGCCVFCGGRQLIEGAMLLDWNSERPINVGKDRNPEAFLFKGRERSGTSALVCESCGYVHLFANSPMRLKLDEGMDGHFALAGGAGELGADGSADTIGTPWEADSGHRTGS